jgi:hypothetical protein
VRKLLALITAVASLVIAFAMPHLAWADALSDQAAKLSAQSFAMLTALNGQSGGGSANPLLGPVATFSGDAETLKKALASGDAAEALSGVQSLQNDRTAIDDALRTNPNALKTADWSAIKTELNQVAAQVATLSGAKPVAAAASSGSASIPVTAGASSPPRVGATASRAPAGPGPSYPPPTVTIDSRSFEGEVVRIKGQIQGTALKSAGIYEHGRCVKSFKVNSVPGQQRIELDIGIGSPPPDTMIQVADAAGRIAEAPVTDPASLPAPSAENLEPPAEPPAAPIALGGGTSESGVDVYRDSASEAAPSEEDSSGTVKEIPSHGVPMGAARSPSRRHTLGSRLANVEINVIDVAPSGTNPNGYEVVGQIVGRGVTRAGIYIDGRLVHRIPIESSANMTSFDETFINDGRVATIRAYGVGSQFVESSLDVTGGAAPIGSLGPLASVERSAAPGIGVMITGVRPIGGNLYQVTGTISGRGIMSAGLYQNGVLAQAIGIGGGGLGGGLGSMLGSLIPGTEQSFNFNLRFNAGAGFASIRAYDRTGAYTEQPVMAGGGGNPYGGVNPYGGSSWGPAPANPYAIGRPPAAPSRPLW